MKAALLENADEIALAIGLTLITVALWPRCGRLALAVPGFVGIYLGLPQRSWFIDRDEEQPPAESRRRPAKELHPRQDLPLIP